MSFSREGLVIGHLRAEALNEVYDTQARQLDFAGMAHRVAQARWTRNGELAMDRNRVLLIGGALVLVLFLAYLLAPGGILPR